MPKLALSSHSGIFATSKRDLSYSLDFMSFKNHVRVTSLYISTSLNKDVKLKLKLWLIVLNYCSKIHQISQLSKTGLTNEVPYQKEKPNFDLA